MSRIYFEGPDATAEVHGSERAYMGLMVNDIAMAAIRSTSGGYLGYAMPSFKRQLISPKDWNEAALMLGFGGRNLVDPQGREYSTFDVILNEVLRVSSDPVKMLARIHGQCEVHGFIEWSNLHWFADIIQRGLDSGIMRPEMGWESVIALCEKSTGPVVMSFSVTDGWPNRHCVDWSAVIDEDREADVDADRDEAWDQLTREAQLTLGWQWLRDRSDHLEIRPDDFDDYYFGQCYTVDGFGWAEHIAAQEA